MIKPLVVIGMHRSGTSALSGELANLGVFMGKTLYKAQKGVNEKGFFENKKLVELNDKILDDLISSWDDPCALISCKKETSSLLTDEAVSLIHSEYSKFDVWGMKDPRVTILLRFWKKIFKLSRLTPNFILMLRNPFEVADSLKKRDCFSLDKSLMLWLNYNFFAYRESQDFKRVIVPFDLLIKSPKLVSNKIASSFDISFKDKQESFIEQGLRSHEIQENKHNTSRFLEKLSFDLYFAIKNDSKETVDDLYNLYLNYCKDINVVLIEHLLKVQESESHFRQVFENSYNTFSWKVFAPFRNFEIKIKSKIK